jgi:hypothetical protein
MVVPEAKQAKPLPAQEGVATRVPRVVGMLGTIRLDYQPLGETDEVDNIRLDHLLPPELEGGQAAIAEHRPEPFLGLGRVGAHPSSAR